MLRILKFSEFNSNIVLESDDPGQGINQAALKKITLAKMMLLTKAAFFGQLAVRLAFVEDRNLPYKTMATDGLRILYDPDFVMRISDAEVRWVICHEIMHCALYHFLRKQPNPKVWNAAADYAINQLIDPNKYDSGGYRDAIGVMPKGGLLDPKYEGWSAERIYQHLIETKKELPPEEGWNYGNVEPPVFVPPPPSTEEDEEEDEDGDDGENKGEKSGDKNNQEKSNKNSSNKAKIGDYVTLSDGTFGEVVSIDPATGDAEINPISEDTLKRIIEQESGKQVLRIR